MAKKQNKNADAKDAEAGQEPVEQPKKMGTSKAVETMFRNAYRAELDTIALAAMKANIMISLNGFIISALMISGAFIFASSPAFLFPAGVFLFTAAASIIFALLAASPERADLFGAIWGWAKAVFRREARLRDLRSHVLDAREPAPADNINLLIYEDRMRLTRDEHWERMQALMADREQVYHSMSDQLYWLGATADRKFRLLNISYTVFRWGLLASVLAFISLKSVLSVVPGSSDNQVRLRNVGIDEFQDIYEPSAVQQLPDGRLLVVEDEASRSMNVLSLAEDGTLVEDKATGLRLMRGLGRKLSDLEGLSISDQGYIFATTSHSRTSKGKRKPDREQLLRFRIQGNNVGEIGSLTTLREAIEGNDALRQAIREATGEDPDFKDLNIEGLAYYREDQQLYLGLREPLAGDQSLVLIIENPDAIFDQGEPPRFGAPIMLDLSGGGIRALSYDPVLDSFLIVNELEGHEDSRYSQLWSWTGDPASPPVPIALPDIINLNNVESIDSILVNGEPRLLIMSDEGSEKKNRAAKYMMLDYEQLGE